MTRPGGGPDAPGPDAPGPDAPGPDAPGPDAPGPDAPGPDAPGPDASALEALGIARGEVVRFRRATATRWQSGTVARMERDGSLRVTDANGAARTVPLALVEVRTGRRARPVWEPVADRAGRAIQLTLAW